MKSVYTKVLPAAFVNHLEADLVLKIGKFAYSRQEMILDLKCANFIAAARLTKALKKLKVTTVLQLFNMGPESLWRMSGVGTAQLYVAMCELDAHHYNVAQWWHWTPTQHDRRHKQTVSGDQARVG